MIAVLIKFILIIENIIQTDDSKIVEMVFPLYSSTKYRYSKTVKIVLNLLYQSKTYKTVSITKLFYYLANIIWLSKITN